MATSIRDVMTPSPETVKPDEPAVEAARRMKEADAGMIPVVDDGTLVGTITDRDIVVRIIAEGRDPGSTRVGDIASRDPVTVEPDRDLDEALRLMAHHQVRRLPVVEEGTLVGVVAQADVAREGADHKIGETVEQISK